jgi:hypothetical protein
MRVIVLLALASSVASAHSAPSSEVRITVGEHEAHVEIQVPASELAHVPVTDAAQLARYLPAHISATTVDGVAWSAAFGAIQPLMIDGHPYWSTSIVWTPPEGADGSRLVLDDDAITHEVRNHYIVVRDGTQMLGVMQYPQHRMTIGAAPHESHRWGYVLIGAAALSLISLITTALRTNATR